MLIFFNTFHSIDSPIFFNLNWFVYEYFTFLLRTSSASAVMTAWSGEMVSLVMIKSRLRRYKNNFPLVETFLYTLNSEGKQTNEIRKMRLVMSGSKYRSFRLVKILENSWRPDEMKFVHVKERKSIILDLSEMFDIWCNTSTESRGKSGGWLRYDKKVRLFFFSFFFKY